MEMTLLFVHLLRENFRCGRMHWTKMSVCDRV